MNTLDDLFGLVALPRALEMAFLFGPVSETL